MDCVPKVPPLLPQVPILGELQSLSHLISNQNAKKWNPFLDRHYKEERREEKEIWKQSLVPAPAKSGTAQVCVPAFWTLFVGVCPASAKLASKFHFLGSPDRIANSWIGLNESSRRHPMIFMSLLVGADRHSAMR